jgi:hypothetical protein
MKKFNKNIMKNLKMLLLITIAVIFFASAESFAYPRHRIHRYYRHRPVYTSIIVRPVHHRIVKKYYVVKRPNIYHRHHRKVVRRVIY